MLTIFTTPKPFIGNIKTTQTNAIRSWAALQPPCEIILFGDEEGTAQLASELKIHHVSQVERNEFGTTLVSAMFRIAQEMATHKLMCYVNADIILMSDFLPAVRQVAKEPFLLVGQRWDIDLKEPLDFRDPAWETKLQAYSKERGRLHGISGIDYFVFPRGLYRDIPPFAIGRPGWDNWMIYRARSLRVPVIDMTRAATMVHQNHGHADYPGGEKAFWEGPEAKRNATLMGTKDHAFGLDYATSVLTVRGLRPALAPTHLYYRGRALPILHHRFHCLLTLFKAFEKSYFGCKKLVNIRQRH